MCNNKNPPPHSRQRRVDLGFFGPDLRQAKRGRIACRKHQPFQLTKVPIRGRLSDEPSRLAERMTAALRERARTGTAKTLATKHIGATSTRDADLRLGTVVRRQRCRQRLSAGHGMIMHQTTRWAGGLLPDVFLRGLPADASAESRCSRSRAVLALRISRSASIASFDSRSARSNRSLSTRRWVMKTPSARRPHEFRTGENVPCTHA